MSSPGPWTDAHCHLADARLTSQLDDIIDRSRDAGVVRWVQGGVGPDDWQSQQELRDRMGADVRVSFGLHPWWVAAASDDELEAGLDALEGGIEAADALGELGLDKHQRRNQQPGSWDRQLSALRAQLALVDRTPRPLVLHVVRAHDEVIAELERHAPFPRGGIVHAFTGTVHDARRYVALGLHLSLGGALAAKPEKAAGLAQIPVDRIVLETDSPDQAPRSWAVQHNEPAFLPRIAQALAPIWRISATELLDQAHISMETLFSS